MLDHDEYIATAETSHIARVCTETVRKWARSNTLPAIHTPLGFLFRRADVERLAQERALRRNRSIKGVTGLSRRSD